MEKEQKNAIEVGKKMRLINDTENLDFGEGYNTDGSYSIFTRGVDRVRYRSLEFLAEYLTDDGPFAAADDLWHAFQDNLVQFIGDNDGVAQKVIVEPKRVNWEAVQDELMGN